MDRFINERDFLGNLILILIDFEFYEIKLHKILEIKRNFELILKQNNINSQVFVTNYEIEKFAYKYFTFLNVDESKKVLKISNPELAQMYLSSAYKTNGNAYRHYLIDSARKTLNILNNSTKI